MKMKKEIKMRKRIRKVKSTTFNFDKDSVLLNFLREFFEVFDNHT